MTIVLAFLAKYWRPIGLSVASVTLGVWLGRQTVHCPMPPPCPSCPVAQCAAAVEAPKCQETAKTVIRYLPNPAPVPKGCPALPPVPEVTVEASGVASAGSLKAEAVSRPPLPGDEVQEAPRPVQALGGPSWSGQLGLGITGEGQLAFPVGFAWNPAGGPVGLGVLGDVRPKVWKQSAVALTLSGRW